MLPRLLLIGAVAAISVGCPSPSAPTPEQEAMARYLAGVGLIHEGRFGEAVLELNAALALHPDRIETLHSLGEAYIGVQRHREAESSFREALEIEPQKYLSHMGLGHALRLQGRSEEAVEAYRGAAKVDPDHPGPHTAIGEVLERRGDEGRAAEAYAEAARLTPPGDRARPLSRSARALHAVGEYQSASGVFREVLSLTPEDTDAWLGLAEALVRSAELEGAAEAYEAASRLNPEDAVTLQLLAAVHEALGRREKAREVLDNALRIAPENPRLWEALARFHLAGEEARPARDAAEQALANLGGGDPLMIRLVADLLADLGDPLRSSELYRLLLLDRDDDVSLLVAYAKQLHLLGRAREVHLSCRRVSDLVERNGASGADLEWCRQRVSDP